jgi:hypothetical protein
VREVSHSVDLTQSEFLSIFASARFADAHQCFEVHEGADRLLTSVTSEKLACWSTLQGMRTL